MRIPARPRSRNSPQEVGTLAAGVGVSKGLGFRFRTQGQAHAGWSRGKPADRRRLEVQISVDSAVVAVDSEEWELVVAEERPRAATGTGVEAVIRARRPN